MQGLVERARALRSASEVLVSGTPGGVFDRRSAGSSSAAIAAEARATATVAAYEVDVTQLAVAQQNVGSQLLTTLAPSEIASGTLQITVAGVTTPVSVAVSPGGTNAEALGAVRDAINAADACVEASIQMTADVSQLELTAARRGTVNGFSVVDTSGSVAAVTGISSATRAATDARVTVNGVDQTLAENKLTLDAPASGGAGRVTLFFQAVTQETARVDVNVSLNADVVANATRRLVGAVNELRGFVADKPQILSRGLLARLNLAVEDLRGSLAKVGVQVAESGAITLDEGALRGALAERPADVEQAIGSIQGLAARERSVAETLLGSSSLAFATKPGPFGEAYARTLRDTARLHNYLLGGLFVNLLV